MENKPVSTAQFEFPGAPFPSCRLRRGDAQACGPGRGHPNACGPRSGKCPGRPSSARRNCSHVLWPPSLAAQILITSSSPVAAPRTMFPRGLLVHSAICAKTFSVNRLMVSLETVAQGTSSKCAAISPVGRQGARPRRFRPSGAGASSRSAARSFRRGPREHLSRPGAGLCEPDFGQDPVANVSVLGRPCRTWPRCSLISASSTCSSGLLATRPGPAGLRPARMPAPAAPPRAPFGRSSLQSWDRSTSRSRSSPSLLVRPPPIPSLFLVPG